MPEPPTDMPTDLVEVLRAHADDVHGLQEAIIYGQELLNARHASALSVEPGPGEEILQVTEFEGYTEVVKRLPEQAQPYLYRVIEEERPDGSSHSHWRLIGRVDADEFDD